jgi:hypothetical protein
VWISSLSSAWEVDGRVPLGDVAVELAELNRRPSMVGATAVLLRRRRSGQTNGRLVAPHDGASHDDKGCMFRGEAAADAKGQDWGKEASR